MPIRCFAGRDPTACSSSTWRSLRFGSAWSEAVYCSIDEKCILNGGSESRCGELLLGRRECLAAACRVVDCRNVKMKAVSPGRGWACTRILLELVDRNLVAWIGMGYPRAD